MQSGECAWRLVIAKGQVFGIEKVLVEDGQRYRADCSIMTEDSLKVKGRNGCLSGECSVRMN